MTKQKKINKMNWFEKTYTNLQKPWLGVKTNFFRLLSLGQKAGLGMRDALVALQNSEKNTVMRAIIEDLIQQINQGITLGQAMQNHAYFFSLEEREMIGSAELIGALPDTLDRVAIDLEEYQAIVRKIKGAMTYPIMLMSITVIAVIVLLRFVIPTIVGLFPSADDLPNITKLMLSASDFIGQYWYVLLFSVIGIVITHKVLLKRVLPYKIFWDGIFLKIPVLSDMIKTFHMYRFSKNFADFYKAWLSPVIALDHIGAIFKNFFYKRKVREIKKNIEWWFSLSESLDGSQLFDPLLIQIIDVGETTGNIDVVLSRASGFYKDQLDVRITQLMKFIEPIMMMFIATIIGGIVWSIFLPMADLLKVMGGA